MLQPAASDRGMVLFADIGSLNGQLVQVLCTLLHRVRLDHDLWGVDGLVPQPFGCFAGAFGGCFDGIVKRWVHGPKGGAFALRPQAGVSASDIGGESAGAA